VSITVQSPYSGRPVKVRDEDVGRAVRDEEGRIFFVLPNPESGGHFGSRTRSGKQRPQAVTPDPDVSLSPSSAASEVDLDQCHDATGEQRSCVRGKLVIVVLIIIMAVLVYLFSPLGPYSWGKMRFGTSPGGHLQVESD